MKSPPIKILPLFASDGLDGHVNQGPGTGRHRHPRNIDSEQALALKVVPARLLFIKRSGIRLPRGSKTNTLFIAPERYTPFVHW